MREDEQKRLGRVEELLTATLPKPEVRLLVSATRSYMNASGLPLDLDHSVPISPNPEARELAYFTARALLEADRRRLSSESGSGCERELERALRRAAHEVRLFDGPSSRRPDVRVGRRFRWKGLEYRITWRGYNEHGEEGVLADEADPSEPLPVTDHGLPIDAVPVCYD